jgi:hypothetical protein
MEESMSDKPPEPPKAFTVVEGGKDSEPDLAKLLEVWRKSPDEARREFLKKIKPE